MTEIIIEFEDEKFYACVTKSEDVYETKKHRWSSPVKHYSENFSVFYGLPGSVNHLNEIHDFKNEKEARKRFFELVKIKDKITITPKIRS